MNKTLLRVAVAATVVAAGTAPAQEEASWGLGVGAVVSDGAYAGRDARVTPLPVVIYESERLFFRGIEGGVHLLRGEQFSLDAIAGARLDGIDAKDFGIPELAANGIDRNLLSDRDDSLDAGVRVGFNGPYGQLRATLVADVLDKSGGFEATVRYGYPLELAENLTLTPYASGNFLSKKMSRYYYGTLDEEIARGVVSYKPDAAFIPGVGASLEYRFAGRWMLLGDVGYKALPGTLKDSPLLDAKGSPSLLIAVIRSF
ncbi:MAG: MipA/OmpV family protein [Steroidobacteraceae bacterium]